MPTFPFFWVDAFTNHALGGNPCAVLFDADELDAGAMQAIAREMNLSETAFVLRSDVADVRARYFTPAEEIPLAGHPTIATMFALAQAGRIPLTGDSTTVKLELQAGVVSVELVAAAGAVQRIVMTQLPPRFMRQYEAAAVLPAFGLAADDLLPGAVIQTVSTGTPQLMIPIRDHAALRRAQLVPALYNQLRAAGDFFSAHLVCLGGATPAGQTFARHLAAFPDTLEDPFTGSATGGMAAYLWHHGLLDSPHFVAEQGHWMGRPGQASVEVVGPRESISAVRVGGSAVLVVQGTLTL
ncbi:MAG: PhzF family phenazine biosynthesis protein [Chloroflexaceae bacterium]|jgi:trans-2,3-dihydro-3-hydroxyanthranilate isomerase|nr:PhzF family phenazine biosynthesis protein [Chloroflexaceae bacterium]